MDLRSTSPIAKIILVSMTGLEEFKLISFVIGIAHGEDVFLIFWNDIRHGLPYSDEEKKVGNALIQLYFDFATTDKARYETIEFDPVKPNDFKGFEIVSPDDHRKVQLDDKFGNVKFWDAIVQKLGAI